MDPSALRSLEDCCGLRRNILRLIGVARISV